MNKFVLLVACAAVLLNSANARPDLSLGYRYNQGHSSGGGSFLQAPGTPSISSSYSPTASGNSYYSSQPSVGQVATSGFTPSTQLSFGSGGSQGFVNGIGSGGFTQGSGFGSGGFSSNTFGSSQFNAGSSFTQSTTGQINADEQQAFLNHLQHHQAPIVSKHFYVHSAPVDHDEQQIVRYINVGRPQKNYRVVFIDAPSSTANKAKIIANVAPTEEKTAIYVLSKKNNALDVSAEVVTPAPVNNKPEVFFVKYRTPQEAIHAQHTIQAQYDSLGGTSDIVNDGPVSVSSVIGSLGGHADDSSSGGVGVGVGSSGSVVDGGDQSNYVAPVDVTHTGINTQQTYLPANHK